MLDRNSRSSFDPRRPHLYPGKSGTGEVAREIPGRRRIGFNGNHVLEKLRQTQREETRASKQLQQLFTRYTAYGFGYERLQNFEKKWVALGENLGRNADARAPRFDFDTRV